MVVVASRAQKGKRAPVALRHLEPQHVPVETERPFEVTQSDGRTFAFLSAGGYHHHIGLNTWESRGGAAPAPGTTGLYHVASVYPTRRGLADALRRLVDAGWPLDGAADHGVSEALYLRDAEGNGVELYRDRDEAEWPRDADGGLAMFSRALDLPGLLAEAE
ncbi:glyoxalase [bacterium]|nr:MAG: glyoxalase [bacterium]